MHILGREEVFAYIMFDFCWSWIAFASYSHWGNFIFSYGIEDTDFSILSIDVQVQGIYEKIFFITIENLKSSQTMMMRSEHILWTWVSRLWGTFTCFTHRNALSIFCRNRLHIFSLKHMWRVHHTPLMDVLM